MQAIPLSSSPTGALYAPALGRRGEYPVFFPVGLSDEQRRPLLEIPGVVAWPGGLRSTWEAAPWLAKRLDMVPPVPPMEESFSEEELYDELVRMPGCQAVKELLGPVMAARPYQAEDALFMARRSWAWNANPARAGKSLELLAAMMLIGAKKTLIVCPAGARPVWVEQITRWLHIEPLVLRGRAGTTARQYCLACNGTGRQPSQLSQDGEDSEVACGACRMRNGQSRGLRLYDDSSESVLVPDASASGPAIAWPYRWRCPKHKAESTYPRCPACTGELHSKIAESSIVLCNFDLLVPQTVSDAAGKRHNRPDLQGWVPVLSRHKFDLIIIDEIFQARGWTSDKARRGQTRRERLFRLARPIPVAWGAGATPIVGKVADLWGPLEILSGGLYGNGKPFAWHLYMCGGHKGDHGWQYEDTSENAKREIPLRRRLFMLQRPRSDILPYLPPKERIIVRLDPESSRAREAMHGEQSALLKAAVESADKAARSKSSSISKALSSSLDEKLPIIVENVLREMEIEGQKAIVFTHLRDSAEKVGKAISKEIKRRSKAFQNVALVWQVHGGTDPDGRASMARAFREHQGPGVFVATIDSCQVAISLKGAESVHFAELHYSPAHLLQAEDRPYEPGTTKLAVYYYIVRGSIDEAVEGIVLSKLGTLEKVMEDKQAGDAKAALRAEADSEETKAAVWKRFITTVIIDEDD